MFTFYIENHEPFGSLTKNCPKLDKNKSIVSRFSVFVVYRSAVSTVQKSNYVGCFNFRQWMFVFAHLFLDFSIKSTKLRFQSWKNISSNDFALFCKMTAEVLRNNCAKRNKNWKFPWYISDISKLAGSKLTRCRVCLSSLQYTPLQDWQVWLWKCIGWKDYWTFLKRIPF